VKRIESVARVSSPARKRELDSMGGRIVEMLTAAAEMAEADIEHEFETLCQKLVASLDALREAVVHANLILDGLITRN
jgi:hypothetical protein